MAESKPVYKVIDIIRGTTVDGPGLRTSIYLAGCQHNCIGCHNPQSHDPLAGKEMSLDEIMEIVREEDFNVTLTGGDPLFRPYSTKLLISELKKDRRNIWVYTGYTWEEIISSTELTETISLADVVVEGKFILSERDTDLRFKGSANQRIIDIKASIKNGNVVTWQN